MTLIDYKTHDMGVIYPIKTFPGFIDISLARMSALKAKLSHVKRVMGHSEKIAA